MDPVTSAALISTGGALVSNAMAGGQSTKERAFNANQAKLNRQFQERMSSTAFQRMKGDMEKAGLNPLLGLGSGGASTPSGSQAQTTATPVSDFIGAGISSAMQAKQIKLMADKQEADIKYTDSQKKKTEMETTLLKKELPKAETIDYLWNKAKSALEFSADRGLKFLQKSPKQHWDNFKHPDVKHNYPKK